MILKLPKEVLYQHVIPLLTREEENCLLVTSKALRKDLLMFRFWQKTVIVEIVIVDKNTELVGGHYYKVNTIQEDKEYETEKKNETSRELTKVAKRRISFQEDAICIFGLVLFSKFVIMLSNELKDLLRDVIVKVIIKDPFLIDDRFHKFERITDNSTMKDYTGYDTLIYYYGLSNDDLLRTINELLSTNPNASIQFQVPKILT